MTSRRRNRPTTTRGRAQAAAGEFDPVIDDPQTIAARRRSSMARDNAASMHACRG
jgi:hypothetical protein